MASNAAGADFDATDEATHAKLLQFPSDDDDENLFMFEFLFGESSDDEGSACTYEGRRLLNKNKERDFDAGLKRIHDDYFSNSPVYSDVDFEMRFRMSRLVFENIRTKVLTREFFLRKE